ncbi:contractile injection system protein, VgrG/Pvc8 family [Thiomicrorhabdus sp.]|uniref:phage late control D family protein n=1 Tax=Thiomicrorhabdus sp. TaxID=2039724 RepID=UPI0029C68DC8|nr:contractile injection system protein, VgrG/Pvc8 family [Thiomicrorhabdus sp.]
MQLKFKIIVDGADITSLVQDRLLSLTVEDKQGLESDSFRLSLDNREGKIALPATQVEVQLHAGIDSLNYLGRFTVDTVEESHPPRTLIIGGSSADLTGSLKSHKQRQWDNTTLEMVLDEIATDNQLELAMHVNFSAYTIEHLDQTAESDLALLNRLAADYHALFKIADGKLIFTLMNVSQRLSGQTLETVTIIQSDCINWRYSHAERNQITEVKTKWRNPAISNENWESVGAAGVTRILSQSFRTQDDAINAANEALRQAQTPQETLSLSVMQTSRMPMIKAETPLQTSGFSPAIDGLWVVNSASHQVSNSGYQVNLEAKRLSS